MTQENARPGDGRIRFAQVGYGRWGPNLARNLGQLRGVDLVAICDGSPDRLEAAAEAHPGARRVTEFGDVLADGGIDAVVLATPASRHFDMALAALEVGKHVLVEKPLAMNVGECDILAAAAEASDCRLMVGHTFLYNPAVRWLRAYIESGALGSVLYGYSQRLNLGQVRHDVDVMWNLAPHDISILLYLFGAEPKAVSASGHAYLQPGVVDVGFVVLEFAGGLSAHVHVSWLDPRKVRTVTVVGSEKMVVYDDVDAEARIRVYDKGIDMVPAAEHSGASTGSLGEHQARLRSGDLLIPRIDYKEPLRIELEEFVAAITEGREPFTGVGDGRRVVRVLEAIQRSLADSGARVDL